MPWFKVDDGLWGHPKWLALSGRPGARALWVTAGSWCAANLTDGNIPTHVLSALGGKTKDASALVEVGLWHVTDGGWKFHEWGEPGRQPTRVDVEAKRADARDRMQRARDAKRSREQDANVRANFASSSHNPGPARPDPTHKPLLTLAGRLTKVDARDLAAGLPAEMVAEWQAIAGPGVDLEAEARAYLARYGDTTPANPRAAWLGWLRRAAEFAARDRQPDLPACLTPGCVGGWLPPDDAPMPCPSCKPHLRSVPDPSTDAREAS